MFHNFTPLQIFCNRIYIFGAETMQILPRNATQKQFDKKNFCSFSHPFLKYGTGFYLSANFCAHQVEFCKWKILQNDKVLRLKDGWTQQSSEKGGIFCPERFESKVFCRFIKIKPLKNNKIYSQTLLQTAVWARLSAFCQSKICLCFLCLYFFRR